MLPTLKGETQISVPTDIPVPRQEIPPTPYDYFAVLPALIAALTPLILGLKPTQNKKKECNQVKHKGRNEKEDE
jgi:hypothetical protein